MKGEMGERKRDDEEGPRERKVGSYTTVPTEPVYKAARGTS